MENMQESKRNMPKKIKNSAREYSDPIPSDLLIDIFSRVPSKSIARFSCVSKFWGSILRRPDFPDLYLSRTSTRPHLLFALGVDNNLLVYSSPQPQNPDEDSCIVATRYNMPFPQYDPADFGRETDMVCGLVFRRRKGKVPMICNPATGEFSLLPIVTIPKEEKACNISRYYFGFDPINKQFKVLCITSSNIHWVLTMETGKRVWRRIEYKPHTPFYTQICINGVLYYSATMEDSDIIVSFDVRSEQFGFINDGSSNVYGNWVLINYKGKLGYLNLNGYNFALWVLEDARDHKWSRREYVLSPRGKNLVECNIFVGMTLTGEIVYKSSQRFYVFYYNLEMGTVARVAIQGFERFMGSFSIFLDYVENIIRLT